MSAAGPIVSAGAVALRKSSGELNVLLVHRPRYDDWSFPKGKTDPYEHVTSAAVREVAEETGLDIRLGPPLSTQTYEVRNGHSTGLRRQLTRTKHVHYWLGRVVGGDDVSGYRANGEIDQVAWMPLDKARELLSYPHDRDTLDEAVHFRKKSFPLLVLRHAKARARSTWRKDDRERPLTRAGEFQSEQLVPILAAYGVTRLVTSDSRRCWTTLGPYAEVTGHDLEETRVLSEEGADPAQVQAVVSTLISLKEPAVLCTHRPVLPLVWDALGTDALPLEPGSLAVVHHRRAKILAVEVHGPPRAR